MSDDSYTLKELVQELRMETSRQSTTLTKITSSLESIEKHLATLNSKVASHEKKFYDYDMLKAKGMVVWAVVVFVATTVVNRLI